MKEALFWKSANSFVQCRLCNHYCLIPQGKTGKCGVRKNVNGKLYSLVYGKPCSIAIDPVEKKPFFHFAPGSHTLSVATVGCNFSCLHCQNWEISQYPKIYGKIYGEEKKPSDIIRMAKDSGSAGISWTYTEPTVFFEYFYDTTKLDRTKTFYQTFVTNGYTTAEPLKKAAKYLDAANVDYKGDDKFYREVCGAKLEPVQETMKLYKKLGIWQEITNLMIPGYNDEKDIILEMVRWIRENLGKEVPLHFSAYYPAYKMNAPPTTLETIERAIKIADEYLDFVYAGNVANERESTFCPKCKKMVIKREGFSVFSFDLKRKGSNFYCHYCGQRIPILGAKWININLAN